MSPSGSLFGRTGMPEHAGQSAGFPARGRSHGEAGVALILVFLSLLVLVVVAGEMSITSSVDRSLAQSELSEMRHDFAARAGLEVARSLLIQDLYEETERQARAAERRCPAERDAFAADCAADSLQDVWADPKACRLTIAADIQVRLRITDEDSKINLLWLACRDARTRTLWKERVVQLLDALREGTAHDLSPAEAESLGDNLEDWFTGDFPRPLPVPRQSTMRKSESRLVWSEERFQERLHAPVVFPLGLDELVHVPGLSADLLDGRGLGDAYLPGLRDVATVWSCLVYDPHDVLQEEPFVWPFMKEQKGWQAKQEKRRQAREILREEETRHGNNGRVNVNTACYAVLRALLPPESLSDSGVRAIVAFCQGGSTRRSPVAGGLADAPFPSGASLMKRLADVTGGALRLDAALAAEVTSALTVRSHVFTVDIDVYDALDSASASPSSYSPTTTSYTTVLWRHQNHEGAVRLIPLTPLTRRPAGLARPALDTPQANDPWTIR